MMYQKLDISSYPRRRLQRSMTLISFIINLAKTRSKLTDQEIADLLENTQFNRQELEEWYKDFQNKYPSGRLNKAEFFKEYGPCLRDSQELADHYFNIFDKDKNGAIDFKELVCAESVSLNDGLRFAFDLYDVNKDGFITRDEMLKIARISYKSLGDPGMVTFPEGTATPEQMVDKNFEDMDVNNDNKLSYEEFLRHMADHSV